MRGEVSRCVVFVVVLPMAALGIYGCIEANTGKPPRTDKMRFVFDEVSQPGCVIVRAESLPTYAPPSETMKAEVAEKALQQRLKDHPGYGASDVQIHKAHTWSSGRKARGPEHTVVTEWIIRLKQ